MEIESARRAKENSPAIYRWVWARWCSAALISVALRQNTPAQSGRLGGGPRCAPALHLASARVSGETEIVATDKRLRDAAKLLGFAICPV